MVSVVNYYIICFRGFYVHLNSFIKIKKSPPLIAITATKVGGYPYRLLTYISTSISTPDLKSTRSLPSNTVIFSTNSLVNLSSYSVMMPLCIARNSVISLIRWRLVCLCALCSCVSCFIDLSL